jgi:pyrimidine-nucleoside phosphorylase
MQGGDVKAVKNPIKYRKINSVEKITAGKDGFISRLDALGFGKAAVSLGCGRNMVRDKIDYNAGIILKKKSGDKVKKGEEICILVGNDKKKLDTARALIDMAVEISDKPKETKSKIMEIID